MNCQETQEQISQFIDNALSQELLQPMFRHLGDCDECRSFFVKASSIHNIVNRLEYTPVPLRLDQKFNVMDIVHRPLMERTFTISIPSAMLSMIALFLFGAAVLLSFDSPSIEQQAQHSPIVSQFPLPNTLEYTRN